MVCSSSCATCTSRVRSPLGSGVSEMRMVSPMPSCSRMPIAADEATMPFEPMPASVRPRCRAWSERAGELAVDGDQVLHAADLGRQDDACRAAGRSASAASADSSADCTIASRITCTAVSGEPASGFSSISRVSSSWSSEPQLTPMRTSLP